MAETSSSSSKKTRVSIVGSGLIGRSWAMLFASARFEVCMFDVDKSQLEQAKTAVLEQLKDLESQGLLRGTLSVQQQYDSIVTTSSLADCVKGAVHVQECVPETVDTKRKVFTQLDSLADDQVILCSSSSAIVPSKFTEHLKHRTKCLVAHPINPPFYCRLVELVPAPWTDPEAVQTTRDLMTSIGQAPITLKKEITGFIQPRIQHAILAECCRLVQDEVISVADVETAVVEGLAPRYAFMGPFETCHLNANGLKDYFDRFGQTIYDVQKSFSAPHPMQGAKAEEAEREVTQWVPLEALPQRRQWRDRRLAALAKLKNELDNSSK
ncbi:lambda-crystallin-like [Liolophura sinensis]|uniref:lambda-crystallin-like n=1 Tax=Liolophura sinensis TaxID=3198878 RepID=UPI00315826BB